MKTAPLICIDRHRLTIDGEGVTTLVAFHGCPLHCKYCLNPQCLEADGVWQEMDTELLMMNVEMDNLYFLATGGGIWWRRTTLAKRIHQGILRAMS